MDLPPAITAQKTEKHNTNRFIFEYLLNSSCYGTNTTTTLTPSPHWKGRQYAAVLNQ